MGLVPPARARDTEEGRAYAKTLAGKVPKRSEGQGRGAITAIPSLRQGFSPPAMAWGTMRGLGTAAGQAVDLGAGHTGGEGGAVLPDKSPKRENTLVAIQSRPLTTRADAPQTLMST